MDLKQTAEQVISSSHGKMLGELFRTHADYIRNKEGEEGLKKLEEKMKELGASIDFRKIKSFDWIEEHKHTLMIVVAKEIFSWTDEDIFEMGRFTPKVSFITKTIMRFFVSTDMIFKEAPKYWRKYVDFGSLETVELNKKEKYMTVRIKDFVTHPLDCLYHRGYFKGVIEFSTKSKGINVEEVKCVHKGDPYHEYKVTWQ